MQDNRISVTLSDADRQAVLSAIQTIRENRKVEVLNRKGGVPDVNSEALNLDAEVSNPKAQVPSAKLLFLTRSLLKISG